MQGHARGTRGARATYVAAAILTARHAAPGMAEYGESDPSDTWTLDIASLLLYYVTECRRAAYAVHREAAQVGARPV